MEASAAHDYVHGAGERMWGGPTASKSWSRDSNPGKPEGITTPQEELNPTFKASGIQF